MGGQVGWVALGFPSPPPPLAHSQPCLLTLTLPQALVMAMETVLLLRLKVMVSVQEWQQLQCWMPWQEGHGKGLGWEQQRPRAGQSRRAIVWP